MNLQLSWQSIGLLIRGSWVRVPPGSQISLFSPQLLEAGVFRRDDGIGIHGRLKICWVLRPWGFESPSRYYLPYGVIGNTTDFGSVIGESYSPRATLYIMYTRTLLYILAIYKKKQYNCKNAWRVSPLSTSHLLSGVLPHYYTHLGPKNSWRKFCNFFRLQNASSPCILCQIFFCHTLYDKNI